MLNFMKILPLVGLLLCQTLNRASAVPVESASPDYVYSDDSEIVEINSNDLSGGAEAPDAVPNEKDIIDLSFYGEALFGSPDFDATGKLVANYSAGDMSVNPEELGSYLEGDILMPNNGGVLTKNGITGQTSRWPNGIVPFEIAGRFTGPESAVIERAIEEYHRMTCIRFVRRTNQQDYVAFVNANSGCWSSVGRVGGRQEINLQTPGCITKYGTALHEIMHAMGFLHEQNRQERDLFVAINYQNIQPHAMSNFDRAAQTMAFGVPYDYGSIMHYSANAFSTNGQPTILAKHAGGNQQMGQRDGFSAFDLEKLNKMYDCGYGSAPSSATGAGIGTGIGTTFGTGTGSFPSSPTGGQNGIVASFLGGLINGLGLGDEKSAATTDN